PSCSPWADSEIRIFLEEWERVERRVGNPGRKISEKSLALSLQLNERRGLKKNWESCVLLMRTLQNLHRRLCSGRPEAIPLFSPYSEALYRILGRPPDPSCSPWVDSEIRIFLQEWEGVERRDGSPGRKTLEKSWALYKRLNEQRGLKKSWDSCFHLLLTLQNLHRTLCNERPETVPLFSPYSEALYRILGRSPGPSVMVIPIFVYIIRNDTFVMFGVPLNSCTCSFSTVPWPLESALGLITSDNPAESFQEELSMASDTPAP
ncbi:Putative uncharacterized protein MSANTD5, partial [Lemmus lemmus]